MENLATLAQLVVSVSVIIVWVFRYDNIVVEFKQYGISDLLRNIVGASKISLATIYNTVHAFKDKGYLKQIPLNANQAYFDTNISDHHHFYDVNEKKLIDLDNSDVGPINIYKKINGKKIKSVEVLVKLED